MKKISLSDHKLKSEASLDVEALGEVFIHFYISTSLCNLQAPSISVDGFNFMAAFNKIFIKPLYVVCN